MAGNGSAARGCTIDRVEFECQNVSFGFPNCGISISECVPPAVFFALRALKLAAQAALHSSYASADETSADTPKRLWPFRTAIERPDVLDPPAVKDIEIEIQPAQRGLDLFS